MLRIRSWQSKSSSVEDANSSDDYIVLNVNLSSTAELYYIRGEKKPANYLVMISLNSLCTVGRTNALRMQPSFFYTDQRLELGIGEISGLVNSATTFNLMISAHRLLEII